jgi:hypothetical protein
MSYYLNTLKDITLRISGQQGGWHENTVNLYTAKKGYGKKD